MSDNRKFDISVIIPIYNTEEYLEETIESVIKQTLGFREHIQLVLINDGSTDCSEEICLKYQKKYPENIIYKYKENGGVSNACNMGKEYAEGTFVNFFGSDDKWSKDIFKSVYDLMKSDVDEKTDVISTKIILFDDMDSEDLRNYQYESTRIVDLTQKEFYNYPQISLGNCFIRNEALKKHRFDEELGFMEDTLFLNTILLEKCYLGLISKGAYYARVRKARNNLSSMARKDKTRYLITPKRCFFRLFELSKDKYGKVLPFIQFSVMFDVQWRFEERLPSHMSIEEIEEYEKMLRELMMDVDDSTIFSLKTLNVRDKIYIYKMRHGDNFFENVEWKNGRAFYKGEKVYTLLGTNRVYWWILETTESEMLLKGSTDLMDLGLPFRIWIEDESGFRYDVNVERFPARDYTAFNGSTLSKGAMIEARVPLSPGKKYSFHVQIADNKPFRMKTGFGWYGRLNHLVENSYWCDKGHILKLINGSICVYKYNKKTHIASEFRYLKRILKNKRKDDQPRFENLGYFGYRLLYYFTKFFSGSKEKWLIIDRVSAATDNGGALFKYACKVNDNRRDIVLALDKSSVDYREMKRYGKVIRPESLKYMIRFLMSDVVISSYADGLSINPFKGATYLLKDLKKSNFVYLQHGVMQDDQASWINVLNRNIKLLSTTTKKETEQIIVGGYGYSEDQVKLLGSPRFDALSGYENKKKIIITPTWCFELAGILKTNKYSYGFTGTEYFRFYDSLINDKRLIEAIKNNDYECEFHIHPTLSMQKKDFHENGTVKIFADDANYEKALGESSIMITDYSGTQFDFAYQNKPVIYAHFYDEDLGVLRQYYGSRKKYFDYDTEGFGPIAHTVDQVVDQLINVLANRGEIEDRYRERAKSFFHYCDNNNSKRVYDAVCTLSSEVGSNYAGR